MDIRKLTDTFYDENSHLQEVLDKTGAKWDKRKTRGYGVVIINLNSLRFGIPFRSAIKHKHSFITKDGKGLDFQKCVLLTNDSYISERPFMIPKDEFERVKSKKYEIEKDFEKYVTRYIDAIKREVNRTIEKEYRFSTLKNYHSELGLNAVDLNESNSMVTETIVEKR
jgi:protein AbiQ